MACQVRCQGQYADQQENLNSLFSLDNLPIISQRESSDRTVQSYWEGIPSTIPWNDPFLQPSSADENGYYYTSDTYLLNHFRIDIDYIAVDEQQSQDQGKYRIIQTRVTAFSGKTSDGGPFCDKLQGNIVTYDALIEGSIAPQPADSNQSVYFTYDVTWNLVANANPNTRWRPFLTLNQAQATPIVRWLSSTVSLLILVLTGGVLYTWIHRDWSYRPIVLMSQEMEEREGLSLKQKTSDDREEASSENRAKIKPFRDEKEEDGFVTVQYNTATTSKPSMLEFSDGIIKTSQQDQGWSPSPAQVEELRIWPLSTRLFFPPRHGAPLLCLLAGTGAHLVVSGLLVAILFRAGIISESLREQLVTAGLVILSVSGMAGGYVTGRLAGGVVQLETKVTWQLVLATGTAYPALGILTTGVVYDVLSDTRVLFGVGVVPLFLFWTCFMIPCTLLGGYLGMLHGPVQDFPISQGTGGYHDLELQSGSGGAAQEGITISCLRRWSVPCGLLSFGGVVPVIGIFVSYAYNVAAPVLVGSFCDSSSHLIVNYVFFGLAASVVSMISFYYRLRLSVYEWWWNTFLCGASSGLHLWLLTTLWIISTHAATTPVAALWSTILWIGYLCFGVSCATGVCGMMGCIVMIRLMYTRSKNHRGHEV